MAARTRLAKLGIDPARIELFGDDSGGGLAAAASIRARDLQGACPPLLGQPLPLHDVPPLGGAGFAGRRLGGGEDVYRRSG
ncbi:alpha/beta hydrolase fold domain-containing protein [Catellatospora sichuanensis]|uniref:alpha/beta hydrolase fold domain-containing protein n=1 Tax=Catellatospora sichuanensis TaxID=1969805 RepID=UPI001C90A159|nr:alpha/beta hydrolase fold domain-containing protein [Catellatospora sichuanensis]